MPRSRCHALVSLALCAVPGLSCGLSGSDPAPRRVAETRSVYEHLRDMDEWREASERPYEYPTARAKLMKRHKTERIFVTDFERPVAFHAIRVPARSSLGFDLQLWPWPKYDQASVRIAVLSYHREGPPQRRDVSLDVRREPGQLLVPFEFTFEGERDVENAVVAVYPADPGRADLPVVALVRPWVRFEREIVPPARAPTQVVLVTLDTVRRDHLGCYGDGEARTPHLDALAADAVVFDDAFAVTNVTNPSHASIFTSLHLKDHKVRDNFTKLSPDCPTLMEGLSQRGFRTAAFVASFNFQSDRSDLAERFDELHGCSEYHERRAEDVNADAFRWLSRHQADDFFAWIHYFDAHLPYSPPHPFDGLFSATGEDTIELPTRVEDIDGLYGDSRNLQDFRNRYRGEIAYVDRELGRLVGRLRELGIYDRAHVIVTADHGESLGENGIYCEHRGLYDATTAVPLIWRFPGGSPAGRRAGLVSSLDLYPTLFDWLGFPIEHLVRGVSLRGLIEAGEAGRERTFAEHVSGVQVAVRSQETLGILGLADERYFPRFATVAGRFELYDLARGQEAPDECSAARPGVAAELRQLLEAFLGDALPFEGRAIEDEEYREMLERLGYVEGRAADPGH